MSALREAPVSDIEWQGAVRIIRSIHPPIDLFEDVADPADWPLLISMAMKTNPRLSESLGKLDLVPEGRRVGGKGASYLMAPFTHVSPDRPSRFTTGHWGVLYAAKEFETAVMETIHHHSRFMGLTGEAPGWTSQFREIVLDVKAPLHDIRGGGWEALLGEDYGEPQEFGLSIRKKGGAGIAYPSVRYDGGECAALFFPDLASNPRQARHLDYHWNGERVDFYRDATSHEVFRIV